MQAQGKGCGFILIFTLFWTLIVGAFDFFIISGIVQQSRAADWPTTTGRITQSGITEEFTEDGMSFQVELRYTYEVDGVTYESDQWRFGAMSSSDSGYALGVIGRYPVDSETPVSYNPDDPSIAVLTTGVEATDLFLLLFLTPFNFVMLGLWTMCIYPLLPKRGEQVGGVRVFITPHEARLRLSAMPPLLAAGITAGVGSFVAVFIVGFTTGMNPSMPVIMTTWCIIGALAVFMYFRQYARLRGGAVDFIIDRTHRMVSLPGMKTGACLIPFEQIRGVSSRRLANSTGDSDFQRYGALLVYRDEHGGEQIHEVGSLHTMQQAHEVAEWMRTHLNAPTIDDPARADESSGHAIDAAELVD